jgi:arylsulfatase A-like enzyme
MYGLCSDQLLVISVCFEADSFLGQLIDALDESGARQETYVLMISDHGEDCTEHRQNGKNNMYDSGSRVVMMLSGPGITAGQVLHTLTSLNDIFPTIIDMAGLAIPEGLAGSSLLPRKNASNSLLQPCMI